MSHPINPSVIRLARRSFHSRTGKHHGEKDVRWNRGSGVRRGLDSVSSGRRDRRGCPSALRQRFRPAPLRYGLVTEYRGSQFDGKSLTFFEKSETKPDSVGRLTFTPLDNATVRQHAETSIDGGKTWTTTYDLYYHRKR